jgi:hypothetical protein
MIDSFDKTNARLCSAENESRPIEIRKGVKHFRRKRLILVHMRKKNREESSLSKISNFQSFIRKKSIYFKQNPEFNA